MNLVKQTNHITVNRGKSLELYSKKLHNYPNSIMFSTRVRRKTTDMTMQ